MSKVLVSEENLTNIANAIREKNGETTTYKPRDMAGAIQNIFGGGSTVTKGIIINEFNESGYATDVSVVGMTAIPHFYFAASSSYTNFLNQYLKNVQLPNNLTSIGNYAFNSCTNLSKFVLPNITMVPTLGSDVFTDTQIANGTGYIYVPDNLVENFKSATNWSTYADQIKAISEMEASA